MGKTAKTKREVMPGATTGRTVELRADARALVRDARELTRRLGALETFTRQIKQLVRQGFTRRGFEFTHRELPLARGARVQIIQIGLGRKLQRALATLRTMQSKSGVGHG